VKALLTQVVFVVGGQPYDWADVALAARLWRDWDILEEEVRQGLACVRQLEDADEEPDPDQVSAAAEAFRYERDLLTAAEAEAWLKRWDLTAESWMDYIERSVLRKEWASDLSGIVAQYPVEADEVTDAIGTEGVCSGRFVQFAWKLAGRAAVHQRMQAEREGDTVPAVRDEWAIKVAGQELPGIDLGVRQEKLATLARLEPTFVQFRELVLTPGAIRNAVTAHRLEWIRLDCRALSFPDQQMAQEALLCIREDGAELAEVGRAAKSAVNEARFFLDETDAESRHAFLGATKGDLLGPLPINGGFSLFRVHEKVLPSAEDPAVRRRAEQDALSRAVQQEINNRVRWQISL
jgi:hypothetical protein